MCFSGHQKQIKDDPASTIAGNKRHASTSSLTQSSASSAQSPTTGASPKNVSPRGSKREKNDDESGSAPTLTAGASSENVSGDGLLKLASPGASGASGAAASTPIPMEISRAASDKNPEDWTVSGLFS